MNPSQKSGNVIALSAVCLASLMFGLEISSVPTILPTIETVLHTDFKQLQWIMNAYTIAVTTVLMVTGTLADRYGRKRMFILSIAVFGIASLVCGLAWNAPILIAARFLQGASGGAMLICQIAILSSQFQEPRDRSRAFGAWGIVFGIGLGFGPMIGAAIAALSSWQWVFLVHVLIAIATGALAFRGVRESLVPEAGHLDVVGGATLSLSVFCLAYFITQGPDLGFLSPVAKAAAGIALTSFIVFLAAERLSPHPMFDFSVFRVRTFSGALFGSMGMNFSFWPFMVYLPIYFQNGLGYDGVSVGLSLLAYTLPTLLFPPVGERLSLRFQPRIVIPAGLFIIGLGFFLMRAGSGMDNASWFTMLPGCLIAGIGLGLTNTPVTNTTTGSVAAARAGMASGIDMSARMISLAINIAIMGLILVEGIASSLRDALPETLDDSQLRTIAQRIAAGGTGSSTPVTVGGLDLSGAVTHAALVHGFGLVMLYGGIAIWGLAVASFLTFGRREDDPHRCRQKPQSSTI